MPGFDTAFDDLPAVKPMATDGLFDDLPDAPAKRKVGPVEAFGRSMGDSIAAVPDFLNEAAAALLRPVDGVIGTDIAGALTRPTGPIKQARSAYKLDQQTEQLDGTGAQLAQGLGPLPRDLVAAFLTSGLSAAPVATVPAVDAGLAASLKALVPELQQGAKAMMVPGALSSRDAYNEARVAGADPFQAVALGTVRGVGTVAQGALPMAKAGSVGTRVASGIPLAVLPNRVQLQAENLVAPESMQHQPTLTDDAAAAIPGMILAGLLGPRGSRVQTPTDISNIRRTDNMNKWGIDRTDGYGPELDPVEPYAPRAPEPYAADPYAVNPKQATADLNEKLFPAPDVAPDLKLVPKVGDAALFSTKSNPDPASIPSKLTLEGDGPNRVLADSDVRNIEKVLGMSEAEVTALPRPAQEALRDHANSFAESKQSFDIADRRQQQADADLANNGQIDPDYQGGGAAARGGAFDAGIRRVTLLDGELPVTLMENDGKKATVAIEQNGKQILVEVDPKRITEHDLPANQRMAQDLNARSSEPPSAVGRGTMASENMPRRSTDRIAGDQYGGRATPYNPNPLDGGRVSGTVLPPDAGTSVVPGSRRAGDTVNGETLRPFDAPNGQRKIAGEGRPMERQQTTNEQTTQQTNKPEQQTGAPRALPAPKEETPINPDPKGASHGQVQKAAEEVLKSSSPDESPLMGKESGNPFDDTGSAPKDSTPEARSLQDIAKDPETMAELNRMAQNAGWAETGGKLLRDQNDNAVGRTKWIPKEDWFVAGLGEANVKEAVRRLGAGEPLNKKQTDAVVHMLDYIEQHDMFGRQAQADELMREAGMPDTAESRLDFDMLDRAATLYPDDFERLAMQHQDSAQSVFIDAVRRMTDEKAKGGSPDRSSAQNENATDTNAPKDGAAAPQDDFKLDPHGDAELRQRERDRAAAGRSERALAAEAAAKEAKAKADREKADIESKVQEKAADPENFVFGEDKKAAANPERNLFDQPATTNPADAKPVAPEVSAKISSAMRKQQGGFIDPDVFGLTKIADAIRKAWGFSFGDAKAHADRLYDISKTLKAVADKTADFRASPIRHIWEMTLETMQGTQRGIQRRNKSETYQRILDQFSAEAGADRAIGETYDAAVQVHTNQYLNRLQKALDPFQRDDGAMQQIVRRVRSGSFDNSPAGKAAKDVAALLKDAHDYMKAAGVEIGEIKNGYYPREFDKQLAMKNPTGFRDALEFEYRKTMPPADAKLAAQRLADTIMYGDTTTMFKANGGQVRTPWAKERVFSKDVDNASHPLNKFLMADAMDNLTRYLQSAVRRAEVSRRFGDKFAHFSNEWADAKGQKQKPLLEQLAAEGAQADIGSLQDFIATMAGLRTSGVSDRWMTASSSLRTWTSLMMLSKATLSSLSEFVTPAIRAAGSTSNPLQLVPDAARMLQWTLADVMHKSRSASAKERRAIADDLGLIAGTHSDMMTAARWSGGDDFSKAQSLTLSNFFSRTYLTQWTEHTRVAATEMGRVFIRRIAKQAGEGDKLAARYLREIGVSDANMKGFTEWVGKTNDGMPGVGDFEGTQGNTYRTALHRFVEQSIMVPTKGTKPGWMNSPQGAVIGQLNSFNYAFYENVVKRNMKLAKGALTEKDMTTVERMRMAYPLLSMPALVAVAYAIGEMRDEVLGDPDRRKEETGGDKLLKAASRGAPIAPLDPFLNFYTAAKYQRSAAQSFAGPGLGSMLSGMDAARNLTANNKDTTNTAERQAARAVWGTLIEPSLQLGLSAFPVAPAYAIMTQVVGSGGAQAAFVDAVAGEDTRKKKQQRQW